jgi:hypothetical protein
MERPRRANWLLSVATLFAGAITAEAGPTAEQLEFFERRVRPILIDTCGNCHSGKKQKANLRLDSREFMLKGGDSGPAIVPGAPERSLLIKAINYNDDLVRMPPKGKLSKEQIADLTDWVRMAAPWPAGETGKSPKTTIAAFDLKERMKHWCWQPPRRPPLPTAKKKTGWVRSPVDAFVLAKLEANGLSPASPADRRTLLRRATFDLTGLPPTPAEIDDFLGDHSADAFARVIDRLLASPHYGERWGRHWLDLARYAETCGHEFDFDIPDASGYRDYVIRAFNADVPYDQFVTEQLAGDLISAPRRHPVEGFNESILGTAIWSLGEAAHSPVDVRADEASRIDNQIDVFGKTFLGLTLACARCHDHKFDAISTRDYYALAGYLQSSRLQRAFIDSPEQSSAAISQIEQLGRSVRHDAVALTAQELLDRLGRCSSSDWQELSRRLLPLDRASTMPQGQTVFEDFHSPEYAGNWYATGYAFGHGPGQAGDCVLNSDATPIQRVLEAPAAHSGLIAPQLQGALRSRTFVIASKKICYHAAGRGCRINLIVDGYQLIREPIYGGLTINVDCGENPTWYVQDVSMWVGERAYFEILDDGPGYIALDKLVFSEAGSPADHPNRLVAGISSQQDLERLVRSIITDWGHGRLAAAPDAADRIAVLNEVLRLYRLSLADQPLASQLHRLHELETGLPVPRRGRALVDGTGVNDRVHIRGNARNLGAEVPRRLPEALGSEQAFAAGSGRLDLAHRLCQPDNPLLARVLVNRLWQHHFGEGIVRSPDNFGVLGERPTHPELLDYLATELIRGGWSIKRIHRLLMLSSAYQMSSQSDEATEAADPGNRLLHRMPLRRLEAESIRDAMLAVAGRLDPHLFGASVPIYLTPHMVGRGRPEKSGPLDGAGRRSIYLAVRRNFLQPMFLAFDYPIPFTTIGRRTVSNVPAQALALMNNPFVVRMAEAWARRVLKERGLSPEQRAEKMYLVAFGRPPSKEEAADALAFLREQKGHDDTRAWIDLAHVLLNVKEFVVVN